MTPLLRPESVVFHFNKHTQQSIDAHRIDRGAFIYEPADCPPFVYLIKEGLIKIGSLSSGGERVVYDILKQGETFGNLHYLDDEGVEFVEFAQTATSVELYAIDFAFFRWAIVHDPLLANWFNTTLVRRWCKAETRLLHQARESIEARIDRFQQDFGTPIRDADNRHHRILSVLSHQEIGDLIGTTRQTISKKLKSLTYLLAPFVTELL